MLAVARNELGCPGRQANLDVAREDSFEGAAVARDARFWHGGAPHGESKPLEQRPYSSQVAVQPAA